MDTNSDERRQLEKQHLDICLELNVDDDVRLESWNNYQKTIQVYTLEGNSLAWVCCALTYSCAQASVNTVQGDKATVHGNGVSFNNILRKCNIGFREFFSKIENWNEMNSVPESFRLRIDRLKKNFENTIYVYKKFGATYQRLFICPSRDESMLSSSQNNSQQQTTQKRKKEKVKCTAKTLFEFCWVLFASIKGQLSDTVQDLIMYHNLLLCCVDLIYANAIAEKRTDLINPKFEGMPKDWKQTNFNGTEVCILSKLCENTPCYEVLEMKKYTFTNMIKKLFHEGALNGNSETFLDILSPDNFDKNYRAINNKYDEYVLNNGEIDEKLFLVADEFGVDNFGGRYALASSTSDSRSQTPVTQSQRGASHSNNNSCRSGNSSGQNHVNPGTDAGAVPMSPLSTATESVKKLIDALGAEERNGSLLPDSLLVKFKNCKDNPITFVKSLMDKSRELFIKRVGNDYSNRWDMVVRVFYRLLENIHRSEMQRKNCNVDAIFVNEWAINSLCACSVEIVFCAYGNPVQFPWILECFDMSAFVFYRIVEPVIIAHDNLLTRNVIDHLKRMEEQCLESYVWHPNSPLWTDLEHFTIPNCQNSHKVPPTSTDVSGNGHQLLSPPPQLHAGTVRQLFMPSSSDAASPQSSDGGGTQVHSELGNLPLPAAEGMITPGSTPTKRTTSLSIFFRKFYMLAYKRLNVLFQDLEFEDNVWLDQIWTIFEHSIVKHVQLMKNRHMDQLIMCSVYVLAKVKREEQKYQFKTIMVKYRNQPHSMSHIYRNVYLRPNTSNDIENESTCGKAQVHMDEVVGQAVDHQNERRGDIIEFYNTIFVPKLQPYALKFGGGDQVKLSPSPAITRNVSSPRRIGSRLTVTTKERDGGPHLILSPVTYNLTHNSPAPVDFKRINENISVNNQGKRLLLDAPLEHTNLPSKKIKALITDRNANRNNNVGGNAFGSSRFD